MAQQVLSPVANYGRSGGILLLNPTDRTIGNYIAPSPYYGGLNPRSARAPAVIRGTPPVSDPGGTSPSTATITTLTPATAVHGAADASVTLTGTGYTAATVVLWDGVPMTTTYTSATSIAFTAPVSTSPAKTVNVTVCKPGERPSAAKPFTLT